MSGGLFTAFRRFNLAGLFRGRSTDDRDTAPSVSRRGSRRFLPSFFSQKPSKSSAKVLRRSIVLLKSLAEVPTAQHGNRDDVSEEGAYSVEGRMDASYSVKTKDLSSADDGGSLANRVERITTEYIASKDSTQDALLCVHILHLSLRIAIKVLGAYLTAGNMKDFAYAWEEISKTIRVLSLLEDEVLFPLVNGATGNAIPTSTLSIRSDEARLLAAAITDALHGAFSAVTSDQFGEWRRTYQDWLLGVDEQVLVLESRLGRTAEERAAAVAKGLIAPAFAHHRADLLWAVGWCAQTLCQAIADEATKYALLGRLALSLQRVCSPSQYTLLRDRVKSNTSVEQWYYLRTEQGADNPGPQSEPADLRRSVQDDPRLAGFFNMLKVGLPVEAVARRMELSLKYSFEKALAILSLDPDSPVPEETAPVPAAAAAAAAAEPSALLFMQIMHECFALSAAKLSGYLASGNTKDFGFALEELQKASTVHAAVEDGLVFPMLDRRAGGASIALSLGAEHAAEKEAMACMLAELRRDKTATLATFERWRGLWETHVGSEERATLPLESALGATHADRLETVFREVASPVFVQSRSEFSWTVGWCAMTLSEQSKTDPAAFELLGKFAKSLQAVCSPADYLLVRGKVKSSVGNDVWVRLMSDFAVDQAGRQTGAVEPMELPVKEDPRFASYFKMLKMGLPVGAVAVKMLAGKGATSIEEAEAILALDPSKPFPKDFFDRRTRAMSGVDGAAPIAAATDELKGASQMLFFVVIHGAVRSICSVLSAYLSSGNMKDFSFAWEEFQKAELFHSEMEDRFTFPALDKLSGSAVSGGVCGEGHAAENAAASAVTAELKKSKTASAEAFDKWRTACLAHLAHEDGVVMPLEGSLGSSAAERASSISRLIISPTFTSNKADLGYLVGWCAMTLSQNGYDSKPPLDSLVDLVKSLQAISSPTQYAFFKAKIKGYIAADQWSRLVKEHGADSPGLQPEPEFQKPPIKDDPRFVKYFKMLKIGLPADAAAQQMVRDQGVTADYDVAMRLLSLDPNAPYSESL